MTDWAKFATILGRMDRAGGSEAPTPFDFKPRPHGGEPLDDRLLCRKLPRLVDATLVVAVARAACA
ncbi:MAG: hypothetical protein KGM43_05475, partial [Planctomycetota bacterium]|nr:hypothetical protein [Planctomycetota bacterium]